MFDLPIRDLYSKVFESSVVAIGITDLEGNYKVVNPAWCEFMGYTAEEAMSLNVKDLTDESDYLCSDDNLKTIVERKTSSVHKTRRYLRKDGSAFWANIHVSALVNDKNEVVGVIGMIVNIDKQVKSEKRLLELNQTLSKLARHDELTGLYNRRAMDEIINRDYKRARRYNLGFGVAIADVDDFKKINDTYGHDCGDEVLKSLAHTFLDSIRDTDAVGRWGGEEFIFVFSDTSLEGAVIVAERICQTLSAQPYKCGNLEFRLTITIGLSHHHGQSSLEDMIKEADNALYHGKRNGKNQVVLAKD